MSRCFPFPPPGYESKPRPDGDVNLIIKEKKQKKHKDKKDKDKKEKKERKEKEGGDGKHKEDKKRKRKEQKDKKDKKKDKAASLEEKKTVGSLENQDGEKLVPDSKPTDSIQNKRNPLELGKGDRNDGGASDNQIFRKITLVEKPKVVNSQGKAHENSNGKLPCRMANGQSLRVDARTLGNGLVGNCYGENRVKAVDGSCQVDKVEKRKEGKERNGYRVFLVEGDGYENEEQNTSTNAEDKRRKENEREENVAVGSKEKIKHGASTGKFLDFCMNDPSGLVKEGVNGFSHENGNQPNNISRPALQCRQGGQNGSGFRPPHKIINLAVEKTAVVTNQKVNGKLSSPQSVIKNARNMEPCQTANTPVAELHNGFNSSQLLHIKRKIEPCHQSTNSIAKVKPVVNSHIPDEKVPLLENGGKTAMQGLNDVHKKESKQLRMNGALQGKDGISSRHSSAKIKAREKVDASVKPPHPDLKYLSQILSVPQVEWSHSDDEQEWLFGSGDSQTKRPKLASPQKHVWATAIQLQSADVTALPYVIPY